MQVTKHFLYAFGVGCGSPEINCGYCGRDHCAPDSDVIDEAEKERMHSRHMKNPNRVILHREVDAISARMISGIAIVEDCECNGLQRIEQLIWSERDRIQTYYKDRAQEMLDEASKLLSNQ